MTSMETNSLLVGDGLISRLTARSPEAAGPTSASASPSTRPASAGITTSAFAPLVFPVVAVTLHRAAASSTMASVSVALICRRRAPPGRHLVHHGRRLHRPRLPLSPPSSAMAVVSIASARLGSGPCPPRPPRLRTSSTAAVAVAVVVLVQPGRLHQPRRGCHRRPRGRRCPHPQRLPLSPVSILSFSPTSTAPGRCPRPRPSRCPRPHPLRRAILVLIHPVVLTHTRPTTLVRLCSGRHPRPPQSSSPSTAAPDVHAGRTG